MVGRKCNIKMDLKQPGLKFIKFVLLWSGWWLASVAGCKRRAVKLCRLPIYITIGLNESQPDSLWSTSCRWNNWASIAKYSTVLCEVRADIGEKFVHCRCNIKLPDGSTSIGDINASFPRRTKKRTTKDAVEYRVNIVAARHVTSRGYKCAWVENGTSPDSHIIWILLWRNVNRCHPVAFSTVWYLEKC